VIKILKPHEVYKSSHKKFWFKCDTCLHEFDITLDKITNRNQWCCYCSSTKLCENENCNQCFTKSFASHTKSQFWSKLNELKPRQVFKSSANKYWFDCDKCVHKFYATTANVNTNYWCPYCANQKLCENKDCRECFNKSFASNFKSTFWSKQNELIPREVFRNSNKKICSIVTTNLIVVWII
jgi:hypothetical protein